MDDLKKYLQQHRSEMDVDAPSNDLWKRIQQQPEEKKQGKVLRFGFRIAAAACIVSVIFFGAKWMLTDKKTDIIPTTKMANNNLPGEKLADTSQKEETTIQDRPELIANTTPAPRVKKQRPSAEALLNDLQNTYGLIVKMQLNQIRNTPVLGEAPGYFNEFKITLNQIDNDEIAIRRNIKTTGLTTELLEQLIGIYQQKLDVLKSLRIEINKMNNKVEQNHPVADSIKGYYINI